MQQKQDISVSAEELMAEVDALLKSVAPQVSQALEDSAVKEEPTDSVKAQVSQKIQEIVAFSQGVSIGDIVKLGEKLLEQKQPEPKVVEYSEDIPQQVIKVVESDVITSDKVDQIIALTESQEDILNWVMTPNKRGAPPKALRHLVEVKNLARKRLGSKSVPAQQQAQKLDLSASLFENSEDKTMLENLTPSDEPVRLVNSRTNKVFLLWSDMLVASQGDLQLRLRKFTVGDKSKPSNPIPSVYLMRGDKVLVSLRAEEFVALIGMIKSMASSGVMDEMLKAFLALSKP